MTAPSCRFCGTALHLTLVDLGTMPLANSYLDPGADLSAEPRYPLHARVCESCYLVQVDDVVDPTAIFSDYAYFSSFSDSWVAHAKAFAQRAVRDFDLNEQSLVIEIASNDGYLLRHFVDAAVPALGIEPAANVAAAARESGVQTVVDFFGTRLATELRDDKLLADLVVANNVLAHVPDLNDFVAGLREVLRPHGLLSVEVPHLLRLLEQGAFDTIYHEHFSYFSLLAMERVLGAHGLSVVDVEELPTHGGSLRVLAARTTRGTTEGKRVKQVRGAEERFGLGTAAPYASFGDRVRRCRRRFRDFLAEHARKGETVVGYGAAAKGNTFLNFCQVMRTEVPLVADLNPYKQGRLLPGTHIPVVAPDELFATSPDVVLVLPWNIVDEVTRQLRDVWHWSGAIATAIPRIRLVR